jgi:preprotein translocase subunit SecF
MSVWSDLYNGDTRFDFPRQWRRSRVVSLVLVVVSVLSIAVLRLDLGLDFEGGSSWEVRAPGVSTSQARDVLGPLGAADAKIQIVDGEVLRIQAPVKDPVKAREIGAELAKLGEVLDIQSVGPSWGDEITKQAIKALVVFFVLIALFLAWRLEWRMAAASLVAVVHDVVITVGIYSLLGLVVTPATVVAFLTIMGYSLYDTIVVFDKARDLASRPSVTSRFGYTDIMNASLNQTMMRSINTTTTSVLPVLAMIVVGVAQGADSLLEFAVALFIGLVVGAYSSIYVAAPVVTWLKEREPKHAVVRERLAARGESTTKRAENTRLVGAVAGAVPGRAASVGTSGSGSSDAPDDAPRGDRAPSVPSGTIPPRPRKKKRR